MAKQFVMKVIEWRPIGFGMFRYRLSCGHTVERVGVVRSRFAIEKPAKTCTCYTCKGKEPTHD